MRQRAGVVIGGIIFLCIGSLELILLLTTPDPKVSHVLAGPSEEQEGETPAAPDEPSIEFEPEYELVEGNYTNQELGFSFTLPAGIEGFLTETDEVADKYITIQIHPEFDSTQASCCPSIDTSPVVMLLESGPLNESLLSTPVPFTGDIYAAFQGYNMRMEIVHIGESTEVLVSGLRSDRNDLPSSPEEPVTRVGKFYYMNTDNRFFSYGLWASQGNYQKYIGEFEASADSISVNDVKAVNLDKLFDHYSTQESDVELQDGSIVHTEVISSSVVESLEIDENSSTINITINETSDIGFLIMNTSNVIARPHVITIDGGQQIESTTLSNERGEYVLAYYYNKEGSHELVIRGSAVLSEFSSLVAVLLASTSALIGMIIVARTRNWQTRL